MTLAALMLAPLVFTPRMPQWLKYASLGVLFVNISIGGTLTAFAAPPVLMVAAQWGWDSAWIDFSKGLGAPIGAVIAGTREFIDEVWRWKQRLGGSMRQAGIAAAACVYALDHHVDRLADDHANARALARGLSQINGIEVQAPETNLVFFKPDGAGISADKMVAELRKRGVWLATMDGRIPDFLDGYSAKRLRQEGADCGRYL